MFRKVFTIIVIIEVLFKRADFCDVVINELNIIDPQKPEKKEFIELTSNCEPYYALRGYKVIGIAAGSPSTIELVVNSWQERFKTSTRFFTIGGMSIQDADMKIPNDNI